MQRRDWKKQRAGGSGPADSRVSSRLWRCEPVGLYSNTSSNTCTFKSSKSKFKSIRSALGGMGEQDSQYLRHVFLLYSHPPQARELRTLNMGRKFLCFEHNALLVKTHSVPGYTAAFRHPEGVLPADSGSLLLILFK